MAGQLHLPASIHLEKRYHANLDSEGKFYFRIDLVLMDARTDRVLAVLDTKYKRNAEPESGDIEQITAYAVSMQTRDAFLIYPSPATNQFDLKVGKDVRVRGLTFDIGKESDDAGNEFLHRLREILL